MLSAFFDSLVALIGRTSTDLPPDVRNAMREACEREERNTRAGHSGASASASMQLGRDRLLDAPGRGRAVTSDGHARAARRGIPQNRPGSPSDPPIIDEQIRARNVGALP